MCIYILGLKLSINALSTNTKMNLIYLSNIRYAKSSDRIRFVPFFNHQNHIKDKKNIFQMGHNVSYKYHTSVRIRHVSDTGHAIYETCQSIINKHPQIIVNHFVNTCHSIL